VWEVGARDFIWQPFPHHLKDADLVIVMQESRLLSNYPLIMKRWLGGPKVAYWGHGRNFQSDAPAGFREKWKFLLLKQVDWWFAYTDMTVDILVEAGYPRSKITNLNNAIDTSSFKSDLASVSDSDLIALRSKIGIGSDARVGLFCGSLYPDKKLDILIGGADKVKSIEENFVLIVIGDGPSMELMREAQLTRPWMHLVGVKKGLEKAAYFSLAEVMLNPGLVGLHIVDAFCAGLVMVTTKNAKHSPEVAYLKNFVNGVATSDSVDAYGDAVLSLLKDSNLLQKMRQQALDDSNFYSLENMVENFSQGVKNALAC
jgi:glycosyltransferase involved in cell wall biosynthesis